MQGHASRLAIVEMIEPIVLQLSCCPWSEAGATMEVLPVENQGNWQAVVRNGSICVAKAHCGDVGHPACEKNIARCQSQSGFGFY